MDKNTIDVLGTLGKVSGYVQDKITGHNPLPEMPLEIELFVTAWDNVKKNYLDQTDSYSAETHEIFTEKLCLQIDEMMMDLVSQFQKRTR